MHGKKVKAVIDTASEITLISDQLYDSFEDKPHVIKNLTLFTAGRDLKMAGYHLGSVDLQIEDLSFREAVTVAPIKDDMLLGLDFLIKHRVDINLERKSLIVDGNEIKFLTGENVKDTVRVARVIIRNRVVVPARSVLQLSCVTEKAMPQCVIEPNVDNLISPFVLIDRCDSQPVMAFINCHDHHIVLKRNQLVGTATEILQVVPEVNIKKTEVCQSTNLNDIPSHLQDLFKRSSQQLTSTQQLILKDLLCQYSDVFSSHEYDIGTFTAIEHGIDTGDSKPIKQRLRRTPVCFAGEEEKHLEKMLKADVIEPSFSEWASPPVLVRKRDGSVRWCVDYRALNKVTKKDVFPLPLVEECMDSLSGNVWYSKLDATWGYWQVKIKDSDKCKTAFITKHGLFHFKRMGFGLCNAPATFSRVMDLVLKGLHWSVVLAFLDDVLVLGRDFESHICNLAKVFQRFRDYGVKLKGKKCELFKPEVEYLGRTVGREGIKVGRSFTDTMKRWTAPTCTKEVERFCGFANYHRNFIKDFAEITAPLYELTGKAPFHWDEKHERSFESVKNALMTAPVLTIPTADGKFILDTDASDIAIGAELSQVQNGVERCISYCSFTLTPEQKKYCTTRKELLAVVRFTRHFRHYLLGRPFDIRTDHSSLQWLMNFRNLNGQLARWLEELSQYRMNIYHRPGHKHQNADALSRIPDIEICPHYQAAVNPENLPCGGCNYCKKVHQNWSEFIRDVDDTIPLINYNQQPKDKEVQCNLLMSETSPQYKEMTIGGFEARAVQTRNSTNSSWVENFSWKEISEKQHAEDDFLFLIKWLTNQETPPENELYLSNSAVKNYWINRHLYEIDKQNVLWKKIDSEESTKQLLVPKVMRDIIIGLCHNIPTSGHQGYDRTLARIQQRFSWYAMTQDIRKFVTSCPACNRNKKATRKARCGMKQFHAGSPMERVHLDFLGPLPVTKKGNAYVLMMVDQFTKWVECVPLPNQSAETTAKAVNEFFLRFGFPFQILTDRGTNFESVLFKNLCECLQIHKTRTTPYRPSANGQVERYNRTLMDALRCFVSRTPTLWDEYVPLLACALRSAKNRSTGFTANMLMLGREVTMPVDLMFPCQEVQNDYNIEQYLLDFIEKMESVHNIARANLKSTQALMKRDYDLKTFARSYQVGDPVYVLDTAAVKGRCRKLNPTWKGPGVITRKLSDYVYEIKLRQKFMTINHDRLKLCSDRQLPAWVTNLQESLKSHSQASGSLASTTNPNQYCVCRGPNDGSFMIQCNECMEWFHGACVDIDSDKAALIDIFLCPQCDKSV